jgi:hypothetical protein
VRRVHVLLLLAAAGCGGSTAANEASGLHSADAVVACLRDDEGLLVPEDDVIHVREGFSVEDPARDESLRPDREDEPEIRGDFTIVRWYSDEDELSKVQLYFAPTEKEATLLRDEQAENYRAGGSSEVDLRRDLERRRNLFLVWDEGATQKMRDQIARCLN